MNARKIPLWRRFTLCFTALSLVAPWPLIPSAMAAPTPLTLSQIPLFISTGTKANVLLILDNSNSMDENASGAAVGSADANSKSEIARGVAKNIVATYAGKINMGLMAYQQGANSLRNLHNSPYDASFDPTHYDASWTGTRASPTHKKFRTPNLSDAGKYVYFNVALPFYSTSNQGTAFCKSTTANASPNIAHPDGFWDVGDSVTGPWDSYSCYNTKTGNSNTTGWSSFINNYTFTPTDSDYAQSIVDFGQYMTWDWVSLTWFNNTSPGRGYLHTPIALLDSTQAGKLNTKLATSQFTNNQPTNAAYPLQNAGLTPIEGTLLTAKDYFGGSWNTAAEGYTAGCYPLPTSCGKDFVVLVTDGLPSTDKNGTLITSTTTALNDAATAAATLKAAGVETYVVGFALPYGTNPAQLDTVAAAGGTGTAYSASNQTTLNAALTAIFADIMQKTGSAAAVATNSTSLNSSSAIYQAKFDSTEWSGQLLAYVVGTTGVIPATPTWDAAQNLPTYSARKIISYKPSSGTGIAFAWPVNPASPTATEMDTAQSTAIGGSAVLDYLRGSASNEGTGSTNYRPRPTTKLGDIINSSPVYVEKPKGGYAESIETVSYSTFVSSYAARTPVLYVGGNDGMLHGFRATDGVEVLAYMPSSVYPQLQSLSSQNYAHRYFVDGSPSAADVFYGSQWHTVLVGGLNGGGQGIYALDITYPAAATGVTNVSGSSTFSEANAASLVLWEFTDRDMNSTSSTNTNFDADLGYTYSQPAIGKMANGKWAAVFGNGYNNTNADGAASTTGNAVLYVVDVQTGQLIKKFDTKKGMASSPNTNTPNGLASPAIVDVDGDEIIDYIYAGDLQGNMWKFDVTNTNPSQWDSAYKSGSNPVPLFTALMGSTPQPITERPEVGEHPEGGYLVYFGTGKYIETGDNSGTGQTTQTFYGIWDNGAAVGNSRSPLLQQQILAEVTSNSELWRLTSNNVPTWTGTSPPPHKGWYIDLYNTEGGNTNNYGERQVSNPILTNKRLVFTTLIPAANPCAYGGDSWLMELNPETGGRFTFSPFDVNGTGGFTTADFLTGGSVATPAPVTGRKLSGGIAGTPAIMYDPSGKTEIKYFSQSSGVLKAVKENPGGASGRVSWREIIGN
ncbi:MAG TPA: PilC/PilY family type IV pilus protein [Azonexus sp.]|nr:PilC/PilY family type IV pilus protein [Azonexus sp.]